jgi:hypothetical protein
MLSIAPMNLARAAYHERSLGHGLDDYYSEWGERPGLWWGGGAELLGLDGYAAPRSIVSLIEGRDPLSGEQLRELQSCLLGGHGVPGGCRRNGGYRCCLGGATLAPGWL